MSKKFLGSDFERVLEELKTYFKMRDLEQVIQELKDELSNLK